MGDFCIHEINFKSVSIQEYLLIEVILHRIKNSNMVGGKQSGFRSLKVGIRYFSSITHFVKERKKITKVYWLSFSCT